MIDRELLGKIKGKIDKDDDFFTDVPPDWAEGKQEETGGKKGKGCLSFLASAALMFFLLFVIGVMLPEEPEEQIDPPSTAALKSEAPSTATLKSEYALYFEKPCLQSARYDDGNGKIRAGWKDRIKKGIINQARKYDRLSERKKLYAAKVNNCKNIIKSSQRLRASPDYIPDYTAEIEKYVIDRCYRELVRKARPDLPAPDFRQIEKIKSVMWKDVEKTIKQILPRVHRKSYKERLTVYESAMDGCRLP